MLMAATTKACAVCKKDFAPVRSMQRVCSLHCARRVPVIAKQTLKAERKVTKAKLDAIKPRGKWIAEAQTAFNGFVRARDAKLPCVSCGTTTASSWNASHYRSTGSAPSLRLDEANCHRSCAQCNLHLHGNLVPYRLELIRRIGQAEVDRLEGQQQPKKFTIDELREIRDRYRKMAKELAV